MNEEMRTETMELCVTACEKFTNNNEVRDNKMISQEDQIENSLASEEKLDGRALAIKIAWLPGQAGCDTVQD